MSKVKYIFILVNLVLLLGYINWSIAAKEKTLENGQLILMKLAPVDPRSLMQGDYMRLRYAIASEIEDQLNDEKMKKQSDKRGYCIVKFDNNKVAQFVRFQPDLQPLATGEQPIRYFSSNNGWRRVHIGAESYFFEEGTAKRYEAAKFGGLKIDAEGNSILTGLYDDQFRLIK